VIPNVHDIVKRNVEVLVFGSVSAIYILVLVERLRWISIEIYMYFLKEGKITVIKVKYFTNHVVINCVNIILFIFR
jgi:hypothetical protein